MNTQVHAQATLPQTPADRPRWELLAALMMDETWGLARAAHSAALQEVCFGLGDHFEALARGKSSPRGLNSLLPLLLDACRGELLRQKSRAIDYRVLMAARLIWAAPALGLRGVEIAKRAWLRVWRRQAGAAVHLRTVLV